MVLKLDQIQRMSVGDTEMAAIDYQDHLDAGELLTGTPTILEQGSTDLTLGNKVVSTAALTILGSTVSIGQAVQFSVTGSSNSTGKLYEVRVTTVSDSTVARTFVRDLRILFD